MDRRKQEGLLDVIARRVDCAYLSELRSPALFPAIAGALRQIEAEAFSVREWEEAAEYIAGEKLSVADALKARETLYKKLKEADKALK